MGGGDLNLKKSWHPHTMKNQERVWKAEQAKKDEERKLDDLRKEISAERSREEIKRFGESTGVLGKTGGNEDKLEWMYKNSNELINRDEYLLGRKIDKSFETLQSEERRQDQSSVGLKQPINHVEHECVPFSIREYRNLQSTEQVDMQRKTMEDPLMLIKQREMESRRKLLENPVKLKEIHRILKIEQEQKSKEASRNKKVKKSKRKSDDNDSSSEDDLDRKLAKQMKKLKGDGDNTDLKLDKLLDAKYRTISKQLDLATKQKGSNKSQRRKDSSNSSTSSSSESSKSDDERAQRERDHARRKDNNTRQEQSMRKRSCSPRRDYHQPQRTANRNRSPFKNFRQPQNWNNRGNARQNFRQEQRHNGRNRSPARNTRQPIRRRSRSRSSERPQQRRRRSRSGERFTDKPQRHRSPTPTKRNQRRSRSDSPQKGSKRDERFNKPRASPPRTSVSTAANSKLSESEREARLRDMMSNATWREAERTASVQKHRQAYAREEAQHKDRDFDKQFINKEVRKAIAQQDSVGNRIRANLNNIQRSSASMNSNFARK